MIVGAALVRNEAGRYLERVLENAWQFCQRIVVLDDNSDDQTPEIAKRMGCNVHEYPEGEASWGNTEGMARARLWALASSLAGPDGWIYVFDADHEMMGISPEGFQELCSSDYANAWGFPLWDCWDSDQQMRVDGYWQAHTTARPWLFKAKPEEGFAALWNTRGVHCGHAPMNYPIQGQVAPPGAAIRHLGYIKEEHRQEKAARYLALAG